MKLQRRGLTSADKALAGVAEFAVVGEGTYGIQVLEHAHRRVARMVLPVAFTPVIYEVLSLGTSVVSDRCGSQDGRRVMEWSEQENYSKLSQTK